MTQVDRTRTGAYLLEDRYGHRHQVEHNGRHCTCHGFPILSRRFDQPREKAS